MLWKDLSGLEDIIENKISNTNDKLWVLGEIGLQVGLVFLYNFLRQSLIL